jgi:hypothetical protein
VKVITWALTKEVPYPANNWKLVKTPNEKYFSATMRHLIAWEQGELLDKESKLSHLAHAITNVLFLLWFQQKEAKMLTLKEDTDDPIYPNEEDTTMATLSKHDYTSIAYGALAACAIGSLSGILMTLTYVFPCC